MINLMFLLIDSGNIQVPPEVMIELTDGDVLLKFPPSDGDQIDLLDDIFNQYMVGFTTEVSMQKISDSCINFIKKISAHISLNNSASSEDGPAIQTSELNIAIDTSPTNSHDVQPIAGPSLYDDSTEVPPVGFGAPSQINTNDSSSDSDASSPQNLPGPSTDTFDAKQIALLNLINTLFENLGISIPTRESIYAQLVAELKSKKQQH